MISHGKREAVLGIPYLRSQSEEASPFLANFTSLDLRELLQFHITPLKEMGYLLKHIPSQKLAYLPEEQTQSA
jgi:hypothetical protein